MMDKIHWSFKDDVIVSEEADVCVAGGGPGGLAAAVFAARAGAKVVLAEQYGVLGGMASSGEVTPFMWSHVHPNAAHPDDALALDRPVYGEWIRKMSLYLPETVRGTLFETDRECIQEKTHIISKDAAALAAEDLCLEAGVRILYHYRLVDSIVRDGRVSEAVFAAKSGFRAIRAKVFIDATGDADLTVLSGGKADFGGPGGFCQPMTLCFKLDHVNTAAMPPYEKCLKLFEKAKAEGRLDCPRENMLIFNTLEDDVLHFNTTRVIHKSGVVAEEFSDAEIEGRRQLRSLLCFLRSDVPGFENARLRSMGIQIGVRESRRIRGVARIGIDDFQRCAKYPDAIARCNYSVDIHNPDGAGTDLRSIPVSDYYEIPYGCIVPAELKNVVVAGRPISVDHAVHSSCRIMPTVLSIGQAAGAAAAMSVRSGTDVCALDGTKVRETLRSMGAYL